MNYFTKILTFVLLLTTAFRADQSLANEQVLDDQLLINRTMLTTGSDEQVRIAAARQLLLDQSEQATDIVINILSGNDNADALKAVCRAISMSPEWSDESVSLDKYIQPLVGVLKTQTPEPAKLAAEALAIYSYDKLKPEFEKVLTDNSVEPDVKISVMNAVSLRLSERDAIATVISLLEDKDAKVAEHAGKILQGWVPMGTDKDLWQYVRDELKRKNPDEIVRERLARQEAKVQQLSEYNKLVVDELINTYELIYSLKNDLEAKSAFLIETLKKPVSSLRLWAVQKVSQWRNSNDVPKDLASAVINVVGDSDESIRLEAAKLIVYMADANPSTKLVEQLKKESSPKVQAALLEALSESSYYALLPSSNIEIDPQVRLFTLEKAAEFLADKSADRAVLGAEVIRKQLEKNGLEDELVKKYIKLVTGRYNGLSENNPPLAARVLTVLSRFCLSDFHYRAIARAELEPIFLNALNSNTSDVRRAAVSGLINIEKASALRILTEKQLYNDPDNSIVSMVIELARDVGTAKDYQWLTEKGKQKVEGVWQAVMAILQREDVSLVERAIASLDSFEIEDSRKIEIFEIGRKKAGIQYKSTVMLAKFYISRENYAQAATLYAELLADPAGKSVAVEDAANAAEVFVKTGKHDDLVSLTTQIIATGDISPESKVAESIKQAIEADKEGKLKEKFTKIPQPEPREGWQKLLASWNPPAAEAKAETAKKEQPEDKPQTPDNKG